MGQEETSQVEEFGAVNELLGFWGLEVRLGEFFCGTQVSAKRTGSQGRRCTAGQDKKEVRSIKPLHHQEELLPNYPNRAANGT